MASYEYYLWFDDRQHGPLPAETVRHEWTRRRLPHTTLYWREGMPDWQPLEPHQGILPSSDEPARLTHETLSGLHDKLRARL